MLYAMAAMVLLTLIVGVITVKTRFTGVLKQGVNLEYFKLMQGYEATEAIVRTTRCFNNLFEVPVLFYAAGAIHISLGIETTASLVLAWLFVIARYGHAAIHLTYNRVLHRMSAFLVALLCAAGLWVNLLVVRM